MLSKNAIYLLEKRYCKPGETPEDVFKRVAEFLARGDLKFEEKLFDAMVNGIFLPNSPCLFNAGTKQNFLHACYVLPIEDNLYSIFQTITNMAYIFKTGGGCGINFSALREKGAPLSSGGTSSGVISFMSLFDRVVDTVKQGGVRRGALMGILDYNHPEILDFIKVKLEGKLQNFNLSIMVTDDFMKKVKNNKEEIDLKSTNGKISSRVKAKDIFELACFAAWCNGDPAFLFFDRINKDNPFYPDVVIRATNPCQPKDSLLLDGDCLRPISEKGLTWTSWKTGIKKVLKLITNNGMELFFTPEHKLQLADGTFEEARNTLNKKLAWGLGNRKAKSINEKYVLYGFLFGDGFSSEGKYGVSVVLEDEKEQEVVNLLLKYGFHKFHKQLNGVYYISRYKLDNWIVDCVQNNLPQRDIPQSIMVANSDIVASFLRGLFEANGSVSINGQISLKSTNKKMLQQVQILLASFGIPSWLVQNKERLIKWHNGTYKSRVSYNLQIAPRNGKLFKEKIGFLSDYKMKKIKECKRSYARALKVIRIEDAGEMEVWDYRMNQEPHYNFCQGVIASNCSEVGLPDWGACCLGSINLSKFVWKNNFNFDKFADYCLLGMKCLTAMNELSDYPLPQIKEFMLKYNPVGLGLMGLADCLIKLGIYYDSEDCLNFLDQLGKVYKEATQSYNPDKFYFYRRIIAPTGSLSIIADCSSGIEPIFNTTFERRLTVGVIEETRDLYKSKYVRTALEIPPEWHVKVLAKIQSFVDGGVSKTINVPYHTSIEDIKKIYLLAWELGVKGITIFRDGCRQDQVLTAKPSQPAKCSDDSCHL